MLKAQLETSLRAGPPEIRRPRLFEMDSQRLVLASPKAGSTSSQSVQMPFPGRLKGVEVFVDTPGAGDRISLTLRDRILVDRWFVDLAPKTSYEKDFDEPVVAGDILTLFYLNADATGKTATWTPTLQLDSETF